MIDPANFITRNPVEDYSLAFVNDQAKFVADKVFPELYVTNRTASVFQYDTTKLKEVETRADSKSEANKIDYGLFKSTITLEEHKLKGDIDPRDEKDFDRPVNNIRQDVAEVVMQKLLIKRERLAATLVETTSNYPSDLTATLSAGDTWLDSGGDPEEDAVTAHNAIKLRCGLTANAAMMSGTSYRKLRTSPQFRDRMKYTTAGPVTMDAVKSYLGVEHLFVGDAVYDSAVEGASASIGDIWADGVLFFVHNPSQSPRTMRYGHMALRNRLWSEEREDPKRGGAEGRVRELEIGWEYKMAQAFVVSSSDTDFAAGYYLDNIV